ncbi:MAG: IS5 family transposase [Gammaproteobacteria bacterium]
MARQILRNDQWDRISGLPPGKAGDPGVTAKDPRRFVEAVLWILRTGAPWRDWPPELGNWHTTYTRFPRWNRTGVWARLLEAVSSDADREEVLLDSSAIRAHPHAAVAQKKHGAQVSGRSRGGWGTKIRRIADTLGNPLTFRLAGAEQADITQAQPLLETIGSPGAVIAEKGCDADDFVAAMDTIGAQPVIPPRSNQRPPRVWDKDRYRARHLIENPFACLKPFRRLATRYDKLASQFAAFVILASTCVWID